MDFSVCLIQKEKQMYLAAADLPHPAQWGELSETGLHKAMGVINKIHTWHQDPRSKVQH